MRRLLAAMALLAFLPNANAQDKAKGDMTHGGELRVRDLWYMAPGADKSTARSTNDIMERFKLDLGFKASDKLSANVTLLNNFNFGEASDTTATNVHDGTQGIGDFLTVNQAYATWMTSDDFTLKVGRMNYQIGDGALISHNDWVATPYSFEGLLANYEAEFGRIQAFAFKFRDLTGVAGTTSADPQRNVYGLNFDLKAMPEMVKMVNVHVLKDNGDAVAGDVAGSTPVKNPGRDLTRYGANVKLMFAMVDLNLWYEGMGGKYHELNATTLGKMDRTSAASMMQAELGANFANFMGSRVFIKYHQDTGNKDGNDTADSLAKSQRYNAFFNDQHCSAGCMDLLGWGNLTSMQIGLTMKPMDTTDVGISYWMFSKTEKGDATATYTRPSDGATQGISGSLGKGLNVDKSKLGDEIDLWAEHHYNSTLSNTIRLGQFMPGDVYKANGGAKKDSITEVFLEAKMVF